MAGLTIAELLNPDPGISHNKASMTVPSFVELLKSLDTGTDRKTAAMAEPSLAGLHTSYTSEFNHTSTAMAEPTLVERVQDLPAELFTYILELTLHIQPGVVHINKDYKPPVQLEICSSMREEAALDYYNNMDFTFEAETKFEWEGTKWEYYDAPYLGPFLFSIADRYRPFVRSIRLWMKGKDTRRKSFFVSPMEFDEYKVAEDNGVAIAVVGEQLEDTQFEGVNIRTNIWPVGEDGGTERDWWSETELGDLEIDDGLPRDSDV